MKTLRWLFALVVAGALSRAPASFAQTAPPAAPPARVALIPLPTIGDVAYGPDAKNRLDFWRAASTRPTPVVIFIHGGGFVAGDKAEARFDPQVSA